MKQALQAFVAVILFSAPCSLYSQGAPAEKPRVLWIAAHPDDLDYTAAGTMATFARQGAQVYYLVLTDGGKGSEDRTMTPERLRDIRREEQRAAAKVLGVQDVFFLDTQTAR